MENTCRNCGNLVYDKMIICNSCIDELKLKTKAAEKKQKRIRKEESEKWKKEWDIIEGNWFLEKFSITNPRFGAILFYFLILLIHIIVFFLGEYLIMFIGKAFVAILGDKFGAIGGTGFLVGSVFIYIGGLLTTIRRLFYFLTLKKSQG